MPKSIGFVLKLTVLALALALTGALPLDSPISSDAESVADVSSHSSRSLAATADGANPPATAIPAATTVEVAPESRAPPASIAVPDSQGEQGSRFLGGLTLGGGDSSKASSKKSKSGSGGPNHWWAEPTKFNLDAMGGDNESTGVPSKKSKKSKKKGQSGGSAEVESGEFTMTITKGSAVPPKKSKKKKNGKIGPEVSVEVESDEVGIKKGSVKSPKKSKKSKKNGNGDAGFEISAEMASDEIGIKKGSVTMTVPKLPKNNLQFGQNPFGAEPGSAEIIITKGSGGPPKKSKSKPNKKGQIVVGVSAELESDEVGNKKNPKKSPKKSKKGKSKSKVKKGDDPDDDDDGQDQEITVVTEYDPLKGAPKGGKGKITTIQTGVAPVVYQVPQQQKQTGVVVKTNQRKQKLSPGDVGYIVESPTVGFVQTVPRLQVVPGTVDYNPGEIKEITVETVDEDGYSNPGRKETAGSAFKAGLKDGESAVNTDFVGDIAADAVGLDGKVSDQDTIFEHALDGVHEVAGGLGGSLIDTVGDATGTGEILTPVASIAGTGLGLAANAKLAEIKGVVTGVKTVAVAAGAQDIIGMQKRKKQG